MMPLEFDSPGWLALLLVLPVLLAVLRSTLLDSPRAQLALMAAVRLAVAALLVLALSSALWVTRSTDVAVLVLADLSDSTPENAGTQVRGLLTDIEGRLPGSAKAGLVIFGASGEIVTPVTARPSFPETIEAPEDRSETNIAGALHLAREIMPGGMMHRVALVSDGNETAGDGLAAAKRLAARGVRVYTMPYEDAVRDEVLLEDLVCPPEARRGQSFSISAIARASADTRARFVLYRNGFKIGERELELKTGINTLTFDEPNPEDGLTKYELHVQAERDFFADNNVSSGIVFVSGEPRVLLLEGDEREGRHLARALAAEDIRVDVREGRGMPGTLEELAAFDAVVFSDVPATEVSARQMELLRSYIEDLGGGFIMIGGEESFGLGGYYRTTIEEALPVRMRSEKRTDMPSLAMMLVIDKSGSMQGEKIQLAKEAAIATVELLTARDYVGVVAFDGAAYCVVDLQSAANQLGIVQTIESIEAGGGTYIYPGLEEAYNALMQVPATFKHTVLLTDGHSQPGDYAGIVDRMVDGQITVSTVAVGEGADTTLLQDIARWGRGRYYFTSDPYDIPQIFTKETMTASKSSLVEEPFLPRVVRSHQVVQGIDWDTTPFLFGYVVTSPKPTAEVHLVTERGDPLLASWRFGLGKTVAWTSDAKGRWAGDWLGWPGYGKFWAQLVRDAMRTSHGRGVETSITYRGDRGRIIVDNMDDAGRFVNGLASSAQIVKPDLSIEDLVLEQTAPGRYEAEFLMKTTGSYLFKVRQTAPQPGSGEEGAVYADFTRGLTVSYKPEYRHLTTNEGFLEQLAEATGGKYKPALEDLFAVGEDEAVPVRRALWPWLLAAALILFVLDVALRRLDLAGWRIGGPPRRYG